jgi:hypothetical protein
MVGLGDLTGGSFSSQAVGISADGSTVVGQGSSASGNAAFLWDATNGMRELDQILANEFGLDLTGWTLHEAYGISDDGRTIVGYGTNPSGYGEAWLATIPEPGTGLLLMTGKRYIFAVALYLPRKRNACIGQCFSTVSEARSCNTLDSL